MLGSQLCGSQGCSRSIDLGEKDQDLLIELDLLGDLDHHQWTCKNWSWSWSLSQKRSDHFLSCIMLAVSLLLVVSV